MLNIRVRACINCKVFVEVETNDASIQDLLQEFEGQHRGHALITCELEDVPDYEKVVPTLLEALM